MVAGRRSRRRPPPPDRGPSLSSRSHIWITHQPATARFMMITLPVGSTARVVKADSRPAVREDLIEPRSAARTSGCPTPVQQPGSDAAESALLSSWTASYAQVVLPRLGELGAFNPRVRGSIPGGPLTSRNRPWSARLGCPAPEDFARSSPSARWLGERAAVAAAVPAGVDRAGRARGRHLARRRRPATTTRRADFATAETLR